MLNRLKYKNFKSWKDSGDIQLAPISGFFGTNSSGKTSLLQGLLLLKQTVESSDRNRVLEFGDDSKYVDLGSMVETIFGHENGELNFEFDWNLATNLKVENPETQKSNLLFSGKKMCFSTNIFFENKDFGVKWLKYKLAEHDFSFAQKNKNEGFELKYEGSEKGFNFKRETGRQWPIPAPVKFYGFPDQVFSYYKNSRFLSDFQLELEKLFAKIYYLGPLREYPKRQYIWRGGSEPNVGSRGEGAVEAILAAQNDNRKIKRGKGNEALFLSEQIAFWLKELGLISSFELRELKKDSGFFQVWVKKTPESPEVLITDVGFGVSQILPVLTLCYFVPEGSILLIEQPEIHLHPKVQAGLADVFIDAIKIRGIQIILESHSEHLLNRFQRRMAEEKMVESDISLFFCETKNGASQIAPLKMNMFGDIENWPKDFFGDEFSEIAQRSLAKIKRLKRA